MNSSKKNKGVIATSHRQITLYFNSQSRRGKQTLAFAKSHGLAIEEIDILNTTLTGTQITELADRLGVRVNEMVNQEHYKYRKKFTAQCFSSEDWITVIQNHPEIMIQPIALWGDKTILVKTPTDIIGV